MNYYETNALSLLTGINWRCGREWYKHLVDHVTPEKILGVRIKEFIAFVVKILLYNRYFTKDYGYLALKYTFLVYKIQGSWLSDN